MARLFTKDVRVRYVFYGALFGLIFPLLATFFDAFVRYGIQCCRAVGSAAHTALALDH